MTHLWIWGAKFYIQNPLYEIQNILGFIYRIKKFVYYEYLNTIFLQSKNNIKYNY